MDAVLCGAHIIGEDMTFRTEQTRIPASIGDISVVLTDYIDEETQSTAKFEVQALQADGSIFQITNGDLVSHLSTAQISGIQALMVNLRTKAQKMLPAEAVK